MKRDWNPAPCQLTGLVLHRLWAWLTYFWRGVMHKNDLVDEGICPDCMYTFSYVQHLHILLCNSDVWVLFPYLRRWLDHIPPAPFQALCGGIISYSPERVVRAHPPTCVKKTKSCVMNGNRVKPGRFESLPNFRDFSLARVWEAVNLQLGSIQKWPSGAFVPETSCSSTSQTGLERP